MRNLRTISFSVLVVLISLIPFDISLNSSSLASFPRNAQEETPVWEMYTTHDEEFSVSMPTLPGVIRSTKCLDIICQTRRIDNAYASYSNGVVYYVASYRATHRPSLEEIIGERIRMEDMNSSDTVRGDVKLGNYKGQTFIIIRKERNSEILTTFYLTDKHVYEVSAVGGSRNDSAIQEFFKSFALGSRKGKEIGTGTAPTAVVIKPSPKVNTQSPNNGRPVNSGGGDRVGGGGGGGPGVGGGISGERTLKPNEVTHKAVIVIKASPEYTEEARRNAVTGTVTLQMVFTDSGRVTNIRTVSGLPYGLTERAIAAAQKIYFLPAIKDGKRVSQYIRVEYNFNFY